MNKKREERNAKGEHDANHPSTLDCTATSPLDTSTYVNHTATLLQNGKVLVAGGSGSAGTTTVLYDPSTGTWTPTRGPLYTTHVHHTATLTANGNVLVAGGGNPDQETAATEMYNPATGIWTYTATSAVRVPTVPLSTPRTNHTATLLSDGRVLVVGGAGSSGTISAGTSAEYTVLPVTVTLVQGSPYGIRGLVTCSLGGQNMAERFPLSTYVKGWSYSLLIPASATNMYISCEGKGPDMSQIWTPLFSKTYPTAVGKTYTFGGTADSPTYDEQTL